MKRFSTLAVILFVALGTVSCNELQKQFGAPEWSDFESAEGRFKVTFPNTPAATSHNAKTEIGNVKYHQFLAEVGGAGYTAAYNDFPKGLATPQTVEAMLDGAKDGQVRNLKGKLTSEKKIKVAGFPGRRTTFECTAQGTRVKCEATLFLVGNRLYQLFVTYPEARPQDAKDVEKFFASFELLKQKSPTAKQTASNK